MKRDHQEIISNDESMVRGKGIHLQTMIKCRAQQADKNSVTSLVGLKDTMSEEISLF